MNSRQNAALMVRSLMLVIMIFTNWLYWQIQGSQLSWNFKCPEIWNCPEILLIWQECPENSFWCTITCCSFLF